MASGYNTRDFSPLSDSLSLRLRLSGLTSPRTLSRRFMMQKVRNRTFPCGHSAFPACRHTISGSLNSPHRGSFHLSLAVLVHYRSTGSIQAYRMVPADSGRITRVPPYLGFPLGQLRFRLRGFHPLWPAFPSGSAIFAGPKCGPATPTQFPAAVWPVPLSLATTSGIEFSLFSSRY